MMVLMRFSDMSSDPDVQDNELSSRFTVNYNMSDKLSFDLIYGNGNSRGNNDVEMYVTEFTEVGYIKLLGLFSI